MKQYSAVVRFSVAVLALTLPVWEVHCAWAMPSQGDAPAQVRSQPSDGSGCGGCHSAPEPVSGHRCSGCFELVTAQIPDSHSASRPVLSVSQAPALPAEEPCLTPVLRRLEGGFGVERELIPRAPDSPRGPRAPPYPTTPLT